MEEGPARPVDCYEILALGRHTQYYYPTCTTFGFATLLLAKIKHSIRFGCVLALGQQLMESSAGRASGGDSRSTASSANVLDQHSTNRTAEQFSS